MNEFEKDINAAGSKEITDSTDKEEALPVLENVSADEKAEESKDVSGEQNALNEQNTAGEQAVSNESNPMNEQNAVSEISGDAAPKGGYSEPRQVRQGGIFGEQTFAPYGGNEYHGGQAAGVPDNGGVNANGQPAGLNYGYSPEMNNPQPMNNVQYGGQYDGRYAASNAGRGQYGGNYGGQYTNGAQYANGAPVYNYGCGQYQQQYGGYNPYYAPRAVPELPAVPEAAEAAVKKPSKALIIVIVLIIAAMLAGLMILLAVNHRNNGDKAPDSPGTSDSVLSEREDPGKKEQTSTGTGVTVNINVQSKPSGDESDYQDMEKGLYTTVGVAKHIAPSIVTLYGYTTTTLTPYSAATGVIISEDGFIITNAHMVEGLSRIKAVTYDEREFEADIIGYEPWYDLAVIRINADNLIPAELGSSSELMQGEQVVAIGNSGGYENTLTVGYVSYVDREIQSYSDHPIRCIQTDAAFNTGISGGALVNMYGQVVGIPTSKSVTDNDENIGFAIAMDFAVPVCEDIIENGYVTWKPRVGVLYRLLDYETAQYLGVRPGMLISEISEDCDIANTELQPDDIITEIDGIPMTSDEALIEFQSKHKAGDTVTAKVYRRTITNEESEFEITFKLEGAE